MAALELNERRSHGWPKFNPTKESFRSFIQRVNEHANATMRTEADALRALPTMLSEEYLEAYRAGINANDTWRTILDKIRDAVLTPAKCSEFQAKLSALSQGGLSVQEFAKQIKEAVNMACLNQSRPTVKQLSPQLCSRNR
ncbi:hypothetical protein L5515_015542 [Caenorhabditis briggsae]|uniref:Retrotransposon gag domain-containing protein n=1 Tax=Caenorhabditis briggsae TaxID=6238 RepID=A0AAE9J894_CAEBR|nr:hypothetical protein L5515_015542 [Caenorhabditis briggsae]